MSITQGLGEEYDQYKQLWNLCQRLVVHIPRGGERCFYYPQGHIEQLDFSTKQEFHNGVDHFNLPSQILCSVIDIQLLVEPETSEIYFRFTLLPDKETDPTVPDPNPAEIHGHEAHSFFGILKASLTSTHGVPARQPSHIPSIVTSSQNMHLGVLSTASHAVMTGTMFVVCYKQRASQFVIRLNKYLEAVNNNIQVGMRFKMRFQNEDSLETSFFGTVVGIEDFSPKWPDSKWRCLKVQWNEPAAFPRPDKVSPWDIEPIATANVMNVSDPLAVKTKQFNPAHVPCSRITSNLPASLPGNSRMRGDGMWPASPVRNESSGLLFEREKDKASTSRLASFCNWFCCCFK